MEIEKLKGVGPKTANIFKNNGIETIEDLISYYPFRYDIIKRSNIEELNDEDSIIIDGVVETNPTIFFFGKRKSKISFKFNTGKYLVNVVLFNRTFLKGKLTPGTILTLIGKFDKKHNTIVVNNLRFSRLSDKEEIEPIYHSFGGFSSNQIRGFIKNIDTYKVDYLLPKYLEEKYKLIDKSEAIKFIHNPEKLIDTKKAQAYLKYEELFMFMLKMNYLKANKSNKEGLSRTVDKKEVDKFIDNLPFKLTEDQSICVDKIYTDLTKEYRMNRLIQGDVGSGKTIVAIIALYINYLAGYQGALMAPTEVLAEQHLNNLKNIFKDYNINIELLTGSLKVSERKKILKKLENKEIDIVIGTHALFSNDVTYSNLGLVITDEQHRFGVNQRSNLKNKGITPDILYLSATPIPRTYALTIYGDMDVSNIKTMPNGRKEIKTILKSSKEIKDVLKLMYEEIKNNHQVYVVAPLIEESDKIDTENVEKLEEELNKAFSKVCKIGVLHGKMSKEEKEKVMTKFKENKISILISTTVIEVGVDVKNATCMVIFDAYRFGLSQLHQLRGRVGRNELQSYCVLVSDKEAERLNIMTKTNNGFKISEEDFKLRGSGDIFGTRQSGDMSFKVANLTTDFNILLKAKEDTEEIIKLIDEYPKLKGLLNNSVNLD